ncbi:hypothetical protein GGX14DRAFT_632466 [Mycena pura]|uniref:Uncharacterized protein n=1 Tax=Mycena pura TaxID=153505 RepID=A0AAD6VCQ8_9AGAR|nr:hypothetical protein GGX14DRAFT_632466 [Mycena pura]
MSTSSSSFSASSSPASSSSSTSSFVVPQTFTPPFPTQSLPPPPTGGGQAGQAGLQSSAQLSRASMFLVLVLATVSNRDLFVFFDLFVFLPARGHPRALLHRAHCTRPYCRPPRALAPSCSSFVTSITSSPPQSTPSSPRSSSSSQCSAGSASDTLLSVSSLLYFLISVSFARGHASRTSILPTAPALIAARLAFLVLFSSFLPNLYLPCRAHHPRRCLLRDCRPLSLRRRARSAEDSVA